MRRLFLTPCYTLVGRCSVQPRLHTTTSRRTLPTLSDQRICDRLWSIMIRSTAISLVIRLVRPTWWRRLWWRQRSIGSGRRSVALQITTVQRTKRYLGRRVRISSTLLICTSHWVLLKRYSVLVVYVLRHRVRLNWSSVQTSRTLITHHCLSVIVRQRQWTLMRKSMSTWMVRWVIRWTWTLTTTLMLPSTLIHRTSN